MAMPAVGVRVPPAVLQVPPGRVGSAADFVGEVAENLGRAPEPEQLVAIDALTSYGPGGRFLSIEAGIEGPRQSTGKTGGVMLPIMLWSALVESDLITWTSHLADTHLASFREVAGQGPGDESGLVSACDWLRRQVRSVSWKDGEEAVTFVNGSRIEWRCRSARRGRGRSGLVNFADEALFLEASAMGAMLPTLATRSLHGNARQYYASSGPAVESVFLRSLIRRAAAGDETLTWVAWRAAGSWADPGCAQDECGHEFGSAGCSLDDEGRWAAANILLGRRTSVEFLRTMRRTLPPREFGREFLGWGEGDDAVNLDVWAGLADPGSRPRPSPVGLAVDVSPRQRSAAVVVAGWREDGAVHVELLAHDRGTSWLPGTLKAMQAGTFRGVKVRHLGGRAPVAALVPDLVAAGVELEVMTDVEFAAACGGFETRINDRTVRHLGESRLSAALAVAGQVATGDGGWVMSRKGSAGDISPAVAAVLAVRDLVSRQQVEVWGVVL